MRVVAAPKPSVPSASASSSTSSSSSSATASIIQTKPSEFVASLLRATARKRKALFDAKVPAEVMTKDGTTAADAVDAAACGLCGKQLSFECRPCAGTGIGSRVYLQCPKCTPTMVCSECKFADALFHVLCQSCGGKGRFSVKSMPQRSVVCDACVSGKRAKLAIPTTPSVSNTADTDVVVIASSDNDEAEREDSGDTEELDDSGGYDEDDDSSGANLGTQSQQQQQQKQQQQQPAPVPASASASASGSGSGSGASAVGRMRRNIKLPRRLVQSPVPVVAGNSGSATVSSVPDASLPASTDSVAAAVASGTGTQSRVGVVSGAGTSSGSTGSAIGAAAVAKKAHRFTVEEGAKLGKLFGELLQARAISAKQYFGTSTKRPSAVPLSETEEWENIASAMPGRTALACYGHAWHKAIRL